MILQLVSLVKGFLAHWAFVCFSLFLSFFGPAFFATFPYFHTVLVSSFVLSVAAVGGWGGMRGNVLGIQ